MVLHKITGTVLIHVATAVVLHLPRSFSKTHAFERTLNCPRKEGSFHQILGESVVSIILHEHHFLLYFNVVMHTPIFNILPVPVFKIGIEFTISGLNINF